MIPAHGFNPVSAPLVNADEADLQFVPAIPDQPNALGYGFLVHGPYKEPDPGARRVNSTIISAGQPGTVFITYRFNLPIATEQQVSTYSMVFLATSGDSPGVSESLEDRQGYYKTVAGIYPIGYLNDAAVPGGMRYTTGSVVRYSLEGYYPNYFQYLFRDIGCVKMAFSSGSLPTQYYLPCPTT